MGDGKWNAPKNHKLAQKPQRRQKTTSSPKNHKDGKKPQARPKTTSSPKNHNRSPFVVLWAVRRSNSSYLTRSALRARDTHSPLIYAHVRGFWRLFPFLTRNALRAFQKPQARPKTTISPKNHNLAQKPQARPKTTSSPKNHKPDKKPQARSKTTKTAKNHKPDKKPQRRQKTTSSPKNHNRAPFVVFWMVVGATLAI